MSESIAEGGLGWILAVTVKVLNNYNFIFNRGGLHMNLGCIYHRSQDNMCYAKNESELVIQIQTGKEVDRVFLNYEDPMESEEFGGPWTWKGHPEEMLQVRELENHKWWTISVFPPYKRCGYFFELRSGDETCYYLEDGVRTDGSFMTGNVRLQYFSFPWMNPADINVTPDWVKDTVWYQIFPERFCNKKASLPKKNILPWAEGSVTNDEFYGGDIPGITSKIGYLADLGITGIYLTPVFEASTTHKYDTTDYRKIDPAFGTEEDFRELVDTAHKAGIRIMLDGVFNHCGYYFPYWQDVLEKGPESAYWNWFMVNKWPFDQTDPWTYDKKYYSFHFTAFMPKLNTNNDEVAEYLTETCEYWIKEFGIDGLRLDVAHEISHKFCRTLRSRLKALRPDFYILGEIWQDSMRWLRGDEFDSVMNYPFHNAVMDFFRDKETDSRNFQYRINKCYSMYMEQTNQVLFNLLDSHDTARLRTKLPDEDSFFQALCILYTMPGSPCIFYGTEIAMEGGPDPDCRRCMPWDAIESGAYQETCDMVKALIRLRRQEPLCRCPGLVFSDPEPNSRVITYRRQEDNRSLTVCINAGSTCTEVPEGCVLLSRRLENRQLLPGGFAVIK